MISKGSMKMQQLYSKDQMIRRHRNIIIDKVLIPIATYNPN